MKRIFKGFLSHPILEPIHRIIIQRYLTSSHAAAKAIGDINEIWRSRIYDVISSPDNARIARCQNAGKLTDYYITMHNGVRVCANGYYGAGILNLLIENKGVHEPQEEFAFEHIVGILPEDCKMLELGAYWGFYSLSLLNRRPNGKCFLVEPDTQNLISGQINFQLNGREGHFTQARVDSFPKDNPKTISVDSFCNENKINHLDILHSDIQGYELAMLEGGRGFLTAGGADFIFISTHSQKLHADCLEMLQNYKYKILAEANMQETFSFDGLIVAKHCSVKFPESIEISKKTTSA